MEHDAMRILVTGGAGYVGSHCLRGCSQAGHEVGVYDNLSQGHRAGRARRACLIEGDLADEAKLTALLRDARSTPSCTSPPWPSSANRSQKPDLYYRNNVVGSFHLLEAMRQAGVRKIVFSSTTATYGTPEKMPIAETTPQQPINPYGFSKLVVEQMLDDYAAAYGFGFAALRYFNAAGAAADGAIGEDHTPESHLIPIVLQVALGQRESISIFGDDYPTPDGTCIRDYVHVDDLATAHLAALERLAARQGDQGESRHRPRLQRARSDRRLPQDHRPRHSRRHRARAAPAIRPSSSPTPAWPAHVSTGRRSTPPSNRSSKPPGAGTNRIRGDTLVG